MHLGVESGILPLNEIMKEGFKGNQAATIHFSLFTESKTRHKTTSSKKMNLKAREQEMDSEEPTS